jgi:hypothetical protein
MRRAFLALTLPILFVLSGNSRADLVTFSTDQTGADTKINADATSSWNFQLLAGGPTITEIQGIFDMKIDGNTPTSNITFTLYQGFDGAEDPLAVVLGSVTLTPASFTKSFSPVTFDISSLDLQSSLTIPTDFSVALTSPTPHNKTYHIKGGDFSGDPSEYINTGTPLAAAAPEPSTIVVALGALVPLGMIVVRRRLSDA